MKELRAQLLNVMGSKINKDLGENLTRRLSRYNTTVDNKLDQIQYIPTSWPNTWKAVTMLHVQCNESIRMSSHPTMQASKDIVAHEMVDGHGDNAEDNH